MKESQEIFPDSLTIQPLLSWPFIQAVGLPSANNRANRPMHTENNNAITATAPNTSGRLVKSISRCSAARIRQGLSPAGHIDYSTIIVMIGTNLLKTSATRMTAPSVITSEGCSRHLLSLCRVSDSFFQCICHVIIMPSFATAFRTGASAVLKSRRSDSKAPGRFPGIWTGFRHRADSGR